MLKTLKHLIFTSLVILSCLLGSAGLAWASCGQTMCNSNPVINSVIPENPDSAYGDLADFDNFAWKTFVALNWPADPSTGDPVGEAISDSPNNPRVWESYKYNQFLRGTAPSPPQTNPPEIRLLGGTEIQFLPPSQVQSQVENQTENIDSIDTKAELYQDLDDPDDDYPDNFDTPLVDQLGNYLFTEIRLNPMEVAQIDRENLFDNPSTPEDSDCEQYKEDGSCQNEKPLFLLDCSQKTIQTDYSRQNIPPIPCQHNNGVGAMEIKAAWMIVPKNPDPIWNFSDNYYTTNRTIKIESADGVARKNVEVKVALVGFHISAKTSRRSWIWATFEHVCNVPDKDDPAGYCQAYNFHNTQCSSGHCQENTPFVKEPYLWQDGDTHHAITTNKGAIQPQIPSQITRQASIENITQDLNGIWQKALENSIWENYKLIGTQWIKSPSEAYKQAAENNLKTIPETLANVTLEPYIQTDPIGGSCVNCHAKAKLGNKAYSDFSYVFSE